MYTVVQCKDIFITALCNNMTLSFLACPQDMYDSSAEAEGKHYIETCIIPFMTTLPAS